MGRCYPHLNLEERRKIDKWRETQMPWSFDGIVRLL